MLNKGDVVEVYIEDISEEGKGIGRTKGIIVFVENAVFGEICEAEIKKLKKRYAIAQKMKTVEISAYYQNPVCEHFSRCGGCMYMNILQKAQMNLKKRQLIKKLEKIGGVDSPNVKDVVFLKEEEAYHYRNKAVFEITTDGNFKKKGGIIESCAPPKIGFKEKKSDKVLHIDNCKIANEAINAAVRATKRFMDEDNITAWDDKWKQGLMRNMAVRVSFATKQVMVNYIISGKSIPNGEKLIGMLDDEIYEIGYELASVNLSSKKDDKNTFDIYGKEIAGYAGKAFIRDKIGKLDFEVSPRSFYQVNGKLTEALYQKIREYAHLTGTENLLDLYCGVGSIGLFCADGAKNVLGIEIINDAVINANRNAVINGNVNARFICGKAEDEIEKLLNDKGESALAKIVQNADVVILDPPRNGCHERLLKTISDIAPKKIVYVSCDGATFARDVKILDEFGYELNEVTPFDMFGFTGHLESVALLLKRNQ